MPADRAGSVRKAWLLSLMTLAFRAWLSCLWTSAWGKVLDPGGTGQGRSLQGGEGSKPGLQGKPAFLLWTWALDSCPPTEKWDSACCGPISVPPEIGDWSPKPQVTVLEAGPLGVTRPQGRVSGFIRQEERNLCLPPEDPAWSLRSSDLGLQPADLCEANSYCPTPQPVVFHRQLPPHCSQAPARLGFD